MFVIIVTIGSKFFEFLLPFMSSCDVFYNVNHVSMKSYYGH